jgi:hypothetical protein
MFNKKMLISMNNNKITTNIEEVIEMKNIINMEEKDNMETTIK